MADRTRRKRSLTFQSHVVSKVTAPTDRDWLVSYRSSISCSVSEILHVNPQTYFWPIYGDLESILDTPLRYAGNVAREE